MGQGRREGPPAFPTQGVKGLGSGVCPGAVLVLKSAAGEGGLLGYRAAFPFLPLQLWGKVRVEGLACLTFLSVPFALLDGVRHRTGWVCPCVLWPTCPLNLVWFVAVTLYPRCLGVGDLLLEGATLFNLGSSAVAEQYMLRGLYPFKD